MLLNGYLYNRSIQKQKFRESQRTFQTLIPKHNVDELSIILMSRTTKLRETSIIIDKKELSNLNQEDVKVEEDLSDTKVVRIDDEEGLLQDIEGGQKIPTDNSENEVNDDVNDVDNEVNDVDVDVDNEVNDMDGGADSQIKTVVVTSF